jgi:hypothetical protein
MSTGTAPDNTSIVRDPPGRDDNAKAAVLVGSGKYRVPPEHFLSKAARQSSAAAPTTDQEVSIRLVDWLLLHVVRIEDTLQKAKLGWILRPATVAQKFMDLQVAGGLVPLSDMSERAMLRAIVKAAAQLPAAALTIGLADVLLLPPNATGVAWADAARVFHFVAKEGDVGEGSASLAQVRATMGGPLAWAGASQFALLNQAPYTLEKTVGSDIIGLPGDLQAAVIGRAFRMTEIPVALALFPAEDDGVNELFRRAQREDDRFVPLFSAAWREAYPAIATIAGESATASYAREITIRAALVMGLAQAGTFNKPMVEQVNASLTAAEPKWLPIGGAPTKWGADLETPEKRLAAAVKLASRAVSASGGDPDGGGGTSAKGSGVVAVVDQSDDAWSDASSDPDIADLLNSLSKLHTLPLDAGACARVMMSAKTPAGLIFLFSTKAPPGTRCMRDMTAARSKTAMAAAMNEAVCVDRSKVKRPEWGMIVSDSVAERMAKGAWIEFSSIVENRVTVASGIDFWADVVRPLIAKEDGEAVAAEMSPTSPDMLSTFLDKERLERATPVLVNLFASVGWTGKQAHGLHSFLQNLSSRVTRIKALVESKGKRACAQAMRYAAALAIDEAQRAHALMLRASVTVARRPAFFFAPDGPAHGVFKLVDDMLSTEAAETRKRLFDPDTAEDGGQRTPKTQRRGEQNSDDLEGQKTGAKGQKQDDGFGSAAKAAGVFIETGSGKIIFGKAFVAIPKEDKKLEEIGCLAKLLSADGGQKDTVKANKWCTRPGACAKEWAKGGDPHAAADKANEFCTISRDDSLLDKETREKAEEDKKLKKLFGGGQQTGGRGGGGRGGGGRGRGGDGRGGKGGAGGRGGRGRGGPNGRRS